MAESLAALGVAANIVQFLELGLKATISIVETYRSINDDGWTSRNVDLDIMAKDLRLHCDRLQEDADIKLDASMKRLLQRCIDTADELSSELRGLAGDDAKRHQKWAKFKMSVAAYFKRGKINEIQARLVEIKTHVFEQLQILLYDNRLSLSRSMRSLEEASEGWNRATEKRLALLAQDLRKLTESQSAAAASTEGLRIFTETWEHVSEEAKGQATILAILTSLRFAQIKERQSEIPKAHRRTFEWVFSDNSSIDFSTWLRESSGLFWITGKPGSGKSTLMKFILGHEQTMLLSEQWADSKPLIVASHFFWSAGTTIQKSQEGLLRTLLFQILVNYPEIIPTVCPLRYSNPFKRLESWSIEELSEVFGRLRNIQPLSSRILLLIDGLDEYNGNLGDLVQFLRSTSESPYIKNQETEASKLVKDIAEKSEGVFFWVSLVVKSLLRGLDNSDDLEILQQRLSEFPSDLDQFFQRMLDTIDPVYKDNASMVFSILLLANSSLPLVLFVELEMLIAMLNVAESRKKRSGPLTSWRQDPDNDSQLTFLLTLLSEEAKQFSTDMEHYQASHKDFSIIQVNRRRYQILAQCRDLVQAWEVSGDYGPQYNWRLGFLHRTVVEFLERASENQWQSAIPFKRYLLARSYLGFIAIGDDFQNRTREERT
ncbi:hypothetical protein ColLi_01676 [Colletotrichum liriopes]|uniref:Nephrocystin 3-like N-terminal domain-containing protein n=1 Tax=Colletotrichum liriopes TaxID=708192 RepID=A0AA37LNS9_9PEZI|nr:hypothetical protein ColLi_01676 [Colletotrichum liriopes]